MSCTDKDVKEQHLSVKSEKQKRAVTLAIPLERSSSVSIQTMVPESPNTEVRKAAIKRRGTHVASVKLTWFDIVKAFFTGPKRLRRRLAAEVEWTDPEEVRVKVRKTGKSEYTAFPQETLRTLEPSRLGRDTVLTSIG